MNLYSIDFLHAAPKDVKRGIKCLLLAENDEQVYEWIKSEPKLKSDYIYSSWQDTEEEGEEFALYDDDDYGLIGTETFKEKIIRVKGQMYDGSYEFNDLYYGLTLYGWTLQKENPVTDFNELIELGIVYKA